MSLGRAGSIPVTRTISKWLWALFAQYNYEDIIQPFGAMPHWPNLAEASDSSPEGSRFESGVGYGKHTDKE